MRASLGLPVPPPYGGPAVKPSFALNLFWHYPGMQGFPVPPLHDGPPVKPSFTQHAIDAFWHYPGAQGMIITMGCVLTLFIAVQAALYIWSRAARTGEMVPAAPGDHEYFSYFKHQWRRSLTVVYAALSAGGLYGLYAVFTKSWVWYPFLVTLAVMVPWTLYTIAVTFRKPVIDIGTHKQTVADPRRPSVDVFIPTCGESRAIVCNTYENVRALTWAGDLNVYALDDSPDESLRGLAGQYGFTYLRRPDRPKGKKSGGLNNAFRNSSGAYIAVFDADFAPAPSFLEQTVPYFGESDVGIVQTSQYFDVTRKDTVNWMAGCPAWCRACSSAGRHRGRTPGTRRSASAPTCCTAGGHWRLRAAFLGARPVVRMWSPAWSCWPGVGVPCTCP